MPLNAPPLLGQVLVCDYDTGFVPPEMVKTRLVVVVTPSLQGRDPRLCGVVPLSTTPAPAGITYQCRIILPESPPPPFEGIVKWAKADMMMTFSWDRLNMPFTKRDRTTRTRRFATIVVRPPQMRLIRAAIIAGLDLGGLTAPP